LPLLLNMMLAAFLKDSERSLGSYGRAESRLLVRTPTGTSSANP